MLTSGSSEKLSAFRMICSWCGSTIQDATPKDKYGMCQNCFASRWAEYERSLRQIDDRKRASDR